MERKPWANTMQAKIRALEAAADLLADAAQDADFLDEDVPPLDRRAAQFYLDKLAFRLQKEADSLLLRAAQRRQT